MQNANKQIGEAIRKVREKKGISKAALGRAVGKDRRTIWLYEKGEVNISATILDAIAKELDTSINNLLPTVAKTTRSKK